MSAKLTATKNYGLFELLDFNRDVVKTKKLEASMRKHGFIPAYPLHCSRLSNGKLRVKAGHHRLIAATHVGIGVYYIVCEDDADIYELEAATTPWRLKDYLASFCRCHTPAYEKVAGYIERTGINIQAAVSMLGGHAAGAGNFGDAFKAGTYRVQDTNHAEDVADLVAHCADAGVGFARLSIFIRALSHVAKVKEFDLGQFKRRVTTNAARMKKQPHLEGYIELIESIYNHGTRDKMPLVFMAKQAARMRQPESLRSSN